MTKTELYEKIIEACGGDPTALPDRLETTELACILGCLGGNLEELDGQMCSDILDAIADACPSGGGGATINNQDKTITENGSYQADSGYTGLGIVTVAVPQQDPVVESLEVTENGTYNPPAGVDGYGPVTVNVEASGGGDTLLEHITGKLTGYSNTTLSSVTDYAFAGNGGLKLLDLPSLLQASFGLCYKCSGLSNVNLPKVTRISGSNGDVSQGSFARCTGLPEIVLPSVSSVWGYGFYGCSALKKADFGATVAFSAKAFEDCAKLDTLILRGASVCNIAGVNVFNKTPFASNGTGGTVYVPEALIPEYQAATNWSSLYAAGTCNFVAIEGSEYE